MTAGSWRCPAGHPITAAEQFDMWCPACQGEVIAIGQRDDPPEYQPDEDATAEAWANAMHEGLPE